MDELDRTQTEARKSMRKTSTKALTKNDNKIIGLNTNRKREMVKESEKYCINGGNRARQEHITCSV
jgi:hypothetical protein